MLTAIVGILNWALSVGTIGTSNVHVTCDRQIN